MVRPPGRHCSRHYRGRTYVAPPAAMQPLARRLPPSLVWLWCVPIVSALSPRKLITARLPDMADRRGGKISGNQADTSSRRRKWLAFARAGTGAARRNVDRQSAACEPRDLSAVLRLKCRSTRHRLGYLIRSDSAYIAVTAILSWLSILRTYSRSLVLA